MTVENTIDIYVDTAKMKTSDIWPLNSRLSAVRARGRKGGRHKVKTYKIQDAKRMYQNKALAIADVCKVLNTSKPILYCI
ncbi:site-specific DNA recombinase; e14 prophage [Legionella busanensis]|uniref:Site-specific DNA recombinase e14 prophage n=1 Tax=Legionella busanensis TaxID=190655 RepID=A0A378KI33_9GAMM|nr:hypothetical protein [Legionella busanensis]STX81434.1 site-specific DNA recombinase; e14 prophage [Legionella busanensis]